jgi:formate-dependent nitrite reductase membrane component NrfD
VPVIHKPHWKWLVIAYFFLGGIAGATYALAAIAEAVDPRSNRPIVRAGRYVSVLALAPCPLLLVLDLGRPERFYMMLRVLKLRSPMSLGTWALTVFGAFSAFSAAAQAAGDGLFGRRLARHAPSPRLGTAVAVAGSPVGLFVAGYTGVLLAATAVPLWTKRALLLGPLFLASSVSTAAAAIAIALPRRTPAHVVDRLERVEHVSALLELGLLAAWLRGLGPTAKPLAVGSTGRVFGQGVVGVGFVLPLMLRSMKVMVVRQGSWFMGYVVSAGTLVGGAALRYAVVVGGNASADDPRESFALASSDSVGPNAVGRWPGKGWKFGRSRLRSGTGGNPSTG